MFDTSLFAGLRVNADSIVLWAQKHGLEEAARMCAFKTKHPQWGDAGGRILSWKLQNEAPKTIEEYLEALRIVDSPLMLEAEEKAPECIRETIRDIVKKHPLHRFGTQYLEFYQKNAAALNSALKHERDFKLSFFGIKTLEKGFFLRNEKGTIVETPQLLFLRSAIQDHPDSLEDAIQQYNDMSLGYYSVASPHLANACLQKNQLASCNLMVIPDNLEGIYKMLFNSAMISKHKGGIGFCASGIRHSQIGAGGSSAGIVPMLKNYNETIRYVDQGATRKGAATVFLQPWHIDARIFLDLKKNTGKEEFRARDLTYALWMNDEFMRRLLLGLDWTLMCPNKAKGLAEQTGKKWLEVYLYWEKNLPDKDKVVIKAIDFWNALLQAQIETGGPFMCWADSGNRKSNQRGIGTIRSSNLCLEVFEVANDEEIASCNLSSISVNKFFKDGKVDYKELGRCVRAIIRNINNAIDQGFTPVPEIKTSNDKHRPIGLGVQGLADLFALLDLPFDSEEARLVNRKVFACIYWNAIRASAQLAKEKGSHESFKKTPASEGKFQFDLWAEERKTRWLPDELWEKIKHVHYEPLDPSEFEETGTWDDLRKEMMAGMRNSLLIALMPTATSAQVFGNNEACEPFTSNMYVRRVLSGDFIVTNHHLIRDLEALGLWTPKVLKWLIANDGKLSKYEVDSKTGIKYETETLATVFSPHLKTRVDKKRLAFLVRKYKTYFELSQKVLAEMEAERGIYVCQSSSHNVCIEHPTPDKLSAYHLYSWALGLKTGMYYLRTKSVSNPMKAPESDDSWTGDEEWKKTFGSEDTEERRSPLSGVAERRPPGLTVGGASAEDEEPVCTNCSS